MNHSPKAVTFPIVLALALAGGNVFAAAPDTKGVSAEQIKAGLPAEIAQDGQQFMNTEKATELQHRVNEQSPDDAQKLRKQLQTKQDGKGEQKKVQNQNQHQYREMESGQHKQQSGSFGAFSGKGSGGGNGGGGGGGR